jgi:predicted nucleic acid-binding protein
MNPIKTIKEAAMWVTNPNIISEAKKIAVEMEKNGIEIMPIQFGEQNNSIFVTTDQKLVRGTEKFTINEKSYFVGWRA